MLVGYARVSTRDQNLDLQLDALRKEGCEKIFTDKDSGTKTERQGLRDALEYLRDGDVLVVYKLDRLGRRVRSLVNWINSLNEKGIQFCSVTERIDTTTAQGRLFFHIMAAMAEMERELIVERTKAGLDAARARGRVGGGKRLMTESKIDTAKRLLKSDLPPKEVADRIGVSVPTLYRWLPASDR